jgi:hypothetical protein
MTKHSPNVYQSSDGTRDRTVIVSLQCYILKVIPDHEDPSIEVLHRSIA